MKAKTLVLAVAAAAGLLSCTMPASAAPAVLSGITDESRIRQDGMELGHVIASRARTGEVAVMMHGGAVIVSVTPSEAKKMKMGQIVDVVADKDGELFARMAP
jgi:hypothetical protein